MNGHRTYIDNAKLISTITRKPPVPRGHRTWIGKVSWRVGDGRACRSLGTAMSSHSALPGGITIAGDAR